MPCCRTNVRRPVSYKYFCRSAYFRRWAESLTARHCFPLHGEAQKFLTSGIKRIINCSHFSITGVFEDEVFENFSTHSTAWKSLKQVTLHFTTSPLFIGIAINSYFRIRPVDFCFSELNCQVLIKLSELFLLKQTKMGDFSFGKVLFGPLIYIISTI